MAQNVRKRRWLRRKKKTAKKLRASERTRLVVYRSSKHMYAQLVDSASGRTITSLSTRSPSIRAGLKSTKDVTAARRVGEAIAQLALERDIREVDFNRNGFVFTGRVQAVADGAREGGLRF
ncbi:MAG: 50S ribosomal protein L18 [Proteobacteria bacterium]|nr:50S ribosomal protein L18 [Pseudomonadota bacterium]